ncbi:zinc ribbon domain-containing protein, partial [Rothia mucilaginosa]|uniref:zinc ribbon domain-containing protein n=1 Tax=Rothia mucilaginosa TaxID=43675 RepID=UPI0034C5DEC0
VYRCDGCGLVMDRDLNAAININVAGSAPETVNAHGGTVKRGDLSDRATLDSVKCEPSRRGGKPRRLGADGRKDALQAKLD